MNFQIGCHVSGAGGVWNAPKNAFDLECETFQIFTRPPMGGPASKIDEECVEKFQAALKQYYPSNPVFVVHCPYFVNFGSANSRIYHGSVSVVSEELKRANMLGAKYVMTHLGSAKDLGDEKAFEQAKKGLTEVLKKYEGTTQFLLEIAAGAGSVIGDTFEELTDLMEPLTKFKTFGGICFDTQHAFSSGYDLRAAEAVKETFMKFDKVIGLKYVKMSHMNDSKIELGGRKDRHEHIGDGKIGQQGFGEMLKYLSKGLKIKDKGLGKFNPTPGTRSSTKQKPKKKGDRESGKVAFDSFPLILETEHDKVKADIKILKQLRDKTI